MALDNLWIYTPTLIILIILFYGLLFKSMFCLCDYIINIFDSLFKLLTKPIEYYKVCMLRKNLLLFPAFHPNGNHSYYNTSCLTNKQFYILRNSIHISAPKGSQWKLTNKNFKWQCNYMKILFIRSQIKNHHT